MLGKEFDRVVQRFPALGDLFNKLDRGEKIEESSLLYPALLVAIILGLVGFDEESGIYKRLDLVQDKIAE